MSVMLLQAPAKTAVSGATESDDFQPSLCLDYVSRHWGRKAARWAVLRDLSLDFDPGTITWIGGRNGVGKTTLLRIAAGILAPDHGVVTFEGLSPRWHRREYYARVGFLSAGDRGLYARLSVQRHLEYAAALCFVPREQRTGVVRATIERFGLDQLASRRVDRLSQGQRQRVRLGLTFLHRPRLVLLDEPRNSLDDEGMAFLVEGVREVLSRGGTVVWCSPAGEHQSIDFDRKFLLEDGQMRLV
jgi:ABC-type multidrug transport system ATPase subunit